MQNKIQDELKDKNIIWQPNFGSQMLFLSSPFYETFYTGTRAVGKSDCLLMDYLQGVGKGYKQNWRGIIFRRTYNELRDLIITSNKWFRRIYPTATYNKADKVWEFPDGELLFLSYFDTADDYNSYHGHSYSWIGWEELLNWPDLEGYELMKSCNRPPAKGVPVKYRATGNTWGIGRNAVKSYFIDPVGSWGIPIKNKTSNDERITITGNMLENIPFMKNQGGFAYRKRLLGLSDKELVKAWVFGDWNVKIGSFFSDVWEDSRNIIPLSRSFIPPSHWFCFRSFDWGSAHPFSIGWWCESDGTEAPNGIIYPRGTLIRFFEYYGNDKSDPKLIKNGIKLTNPEISGIIERTERQWPHLRIRKGPADNQIFQEMGGPSIHAQMGGNLFVQSDKSRIAGWQQMRDRLAFTGGEGTGLMVMEWCSDFLRTVPYLQRDEKNLEDVAGNQEDHISDDTRYACMFRKMKTHFDTINTSEFMIY